MYNDIIASSSSSGEGLNIVLIIGLAIFFGTIGAKVFQILRIPQIIGYIVIGIIMGPGLGQISLRTLEVLEPFNVFALGIIGFMIGGELKRDVFVKFGRQVIAILVFEGLTAFLLVGTLSFGVMMMFGTEWHMSLAVAAVFAAICAATDPASTVNVLWEYKTRGPLTSMLTAIVALDDALAMILYIVSVSVAGALTGHQAEGGVLTIVFHALYEIVGSLLLGFGAGWLLSWIIKRIKEDERVLVFTLGTIILTIGIATNFGMDVILSAMAMGVTLINCIPRRSIKSFEIIRKISPPVYVLFFVIIGSRLNISNINGQVLLLAGAYIFGSIIGKTSGSCWGASYSKAIPVIRKYLGFCLYQQGTIAIALLIMASGRFEGAIRDTMISVIVIGVFVLQLIGPLCVKLGVKKAGEVGMNITEEDLIKSFKVSDVMETDVPLISSGLCLSEVIKVVSSTKSFYYSVVDQNNNLVGAVTLDGIRNTFMTQEINDWLIALDIAEPIIERISPQMPLEEAFGKSEKLNLDYIPVTISEEDKQFAGILNVRAAHRSLSTEVLSRQQKADNIHSIQAP